MTALANNLSTVFPQTPDPPTPEVSAISAALDAAMAAHITAVFVPAGFSASFLAALTIPPTPFLIQLASYLESVLAPILTTALTAETNPSAPLPHLVAWFQIQPSFDALLGAIPSFMAGLDGVLFWQVILFTIRFVIIPTPPIPPEEESTSSEGESSNEPIITLEESL